MVVRMEGEFPDPGSVSLQGIQALSSMNIPKFNRLVVTTANDAIACSGIENIHNWLCVSIRAKSN